MHGNGLKKKTHRFSMQKDAARIRIFVEKDNKIINATGKKKESRETNPAPCKIR